jgi:hypothetical protein
VEVNGQLHAPAALLPEKETLVTIGYEGTFGKTYVVERIILTWILRNWCVRMWTRFIWLRIGCSSGLL